MSTSRLVGGRLFGFRIMISLRVRNFHLHSKALVRSRVMKRYFIPRLRPFKYRFLSLLSAVAPLYFSRSLPKPLKDFACYHA